MLSRTVTIQTEDNATEADYAKETARAIGSLLLAVSDEIKVLTFTLVFAKLDPDVQARIRAALSSASP